MDRSVSGLYLRQLSITEVKTVCSIRILVDNNNIQNLVASNIAILRLSHFIIHNVKTKLSQTRHFIVFADQNQFVHYFSTMKQSFVFYFFKLTVITLEMAAVFQEKIQLKSRIRMFLLYEVWPVVFVLLWVPLVPMVFLKAVQLQSNKNWDQLLDIMHMFFVGCFALYIGCVIQITSENYKKTMEIVQEKFRTKHEIVLREFLSVSILWVGIPLCILFYFSGCIFYKENLVPLWVPFVDNNKELSTEVFLGIWVYELLAAFYMLVTFTIWGPFIIVSTICICKELDCLVGVVNWYGFTYIADGNFQQEKEGRWCSDAQFRGRMSSGQDMIRFVRKIVQHHITINSAISNVSRISNYVFLVQTNFTVVHSCVLAFNLHYTTHVGKVMLKSTPMLFASYYLMFTYCWNGQNLSDKCNQLTLALHCFPWYNCPRSYWSSMLIMIEVLKRPVYLRGGGIVKASLGTFITCFQQSFSYILILRALTPEKGPS